MLRGGIGLRAFTAIIESAGWPIVLRAEVGGGWFFAFGLANASTTARIVIADVNASWKLAEWFRLGVGGIAVAPFDATENFGYAIYVNGRFTALFGGKKQRPERAGCPGGAGEVTGPPVRSPLRNPSPFVCPRTPPGSP